MVRPTLKKLYREKVTVRRITELNVEIFNPCRILKSSYIKLQKNVALLRDFFHITLILPKSTEVPH